MVCPTVEHKTQDWGYALGFFSWIIALEEFCMVYWMLTWDVNLNVIIGIFYGILRV